MHKPDRVSVSPACLLFPEAEASSPQCWERGDLQPDCPGQWILLGWSTSLGKWLTLLVP